MRRHPLGIYEKALPAGLSWPERLALAKACGFDFVEISIDETDHRLARLDWSAEERLALVRACLDTGVGVPSMCLSGHRRFPFGSHDPAIVARANEVMDESKSAAKQEGERIISSARAEIDREVQAAKEGLPARDLLAAVHRSAAKNKPK